MKTGLALSGGGARGIAHIGVLKAFEEEGFHPDVVSGTSAGSIVGAMYCAGKTADEMIDFVSRSSFVRSFDWKIPFDGLASLDSFSRQFSEFLGLETFEDLRKPFYVIVTNLLAGTYEVFSSGPLIKAVVASSTIPLIFKPVEIDGKIYVDGGLMMNFPVSTLKSQCDFTLGINLWPKVAAERGEVKNMIGIAQRCFELVLERNSHTDAVYSDFVIEPKRLRKTSIFQYGRWKEFIDIGYEAGKKSLPLILEKMKEKGD